MQANKRFEGLFNWWWRLQGAAYAPGSVPVRAGETLGGAVEDANLLVAFAAQSRRNVEVKKVESLMNAVQAINMAQSERREPTAAELTGFWSSYDSFAVDMAPLSAHSIRASMRLNGLRFPASLFTPTAYNAGLAVVVFLLCLALQGFWVAGDELIKRAAQLESQRLDLMQRQERNDGVLRRAQGKQLDRVQRICEIATCKQEFAEFMEGPPPQKALRVEDQGQLSVLRIEFLAQRGEFADKSFIRDELNSEQERLTEQAYPLQTLLTKWHKRARDVCAVPYMRYLCPVDYLPESDGDEIKSLRDALSSKVDELRKLRATVPQSSGASADPIDRMQREGYLSVAPWGVSPVGFLQREIARLDKEIRSKEAENFRSIVVEVRIIAANISAYLIAMVMGVLGALTFILRSISVQLREHTYVPISASISIVRICLGAIAGVFGSLIVPGSDMGMKSLPPLFIPFIFGYGIEILFSLLDKLVRSFTQPDHGGPPAPRAA